MSLWWQTVASGSRLRVVLLQVDVGGHSTWLASEHSRNFLAPCKERSALCTSLTTQLAYLGFGRLFWAGDGGVFAAKVSESGHPERLCDAGDLVFQLFRKWRQSKPVELRLTATSLELNVDPEPGNWCGPEFNDFLKYERHIALPNAFVITSTLRAALVDSSSLRRFKKRRQVYLPNGSVMTCYTDDRHQPNVPKSPNSFGVWLREKLEATTMPTAERLGKGMIRVGACTVLDTAWRESGYGDMVLEPQAPEPTADALIKSDRASWERGKAELLARRVSGTSLQVRRFVPELSDDPHPRLAYQTVNYADARAFHAMLEQVPGRVAVYRDRALRVMGDGTTIPNILSTAVVAIIGEDTPELVIANRKTRTGGYHGNCWAVSIGEQFMPLSGTRAGRHVTADVSIEASAIRGLHEELLGEDFARPMKVSTQAFVMEDYINDFIFVAIADLRPLTFKELGSLWRTAVDRGEHDAIAAFPATEKTIRACIAGDALPSSVWSAIVKHGDVEFGAGISDLSGDAHRWQPNSGIRLAAAWWHVDRADRPPNKGLQPTKARRPRLHG